VNRERARERETDTPAPPFHQNLPPSSRSLNSLFSLSLSLHSLQVRDPSKYPAGTWPAGVAVVPGDVTDPASLLPALDGADAAIFAASAGKGVLPATVDEAGVANLASKAAGLGRVVLISSALVDPKNGWHPIRLLLNNMRPGKVSEERESRDTAREDGWMEGRRGHLTSLFLFSALPFRR